MIMGVVLGLALVLPVVGCAEQRSNAEQADGSGSPATPSTAPPSYALDGCVRTGEGDVFDIAREDGWPPQQGVLLGQGPRGVVLSAQSNGGVCQWLDFGRELAAAGYHVALWDYQGRDVSVDHTSGELRQVLDHLRDAGARRIVLAGASKGGCASIDVAARAPAGVQGVVSLSCSGRTDADESVLNPRVGAVRVPLLLAVAEVDVFVTVATMRATLARATARDKELLVVPGSDHGVDLLEGPDPRVRQAVLAFLDRTTRA